MRHVGFIAIGLIAIACGPDPNARLPGSPTVINNGGAVSSSGGDSSGGQGAGGVGAGGATQSNGGSVGTGGSKVQPGSGGAAGANPFDQGGTSGNGSGGKVGSGGAAGANPFDQGGAAGKGNGGVTSSGGVSSGGGSTSKGGSGGGSTSSGWGVGPEPCSPAKDLSCSSGNGNTGNFDGTTFCFRTADKIAGWSCNNMEGWTMTVNGKETACTSGTVSASTLPPAINGIWYFQFTGAASAKPWASLSWYANTGDCKAGPYPAWGSGDSSTSVDGGT